MKPIISCQDRLKFIRGITIIILIFIFLSTSNLFSQVTEEWVARYNGPENSYDEAYAIALDSSGNIYVTGMSWSGTSSDYATIKYNSSGVEQWVARYNGTANADDWARGIAVDSSGNVYVTGWSYGSGTYYDYATIKYNSAGVQQWVARYTSPGNSWNKAYAIVLDSSGNVYVTGKSWGSGTDDDYATIKYNSAGVEQWVARYNGPGNSADWAYAIALDSSGNVYVTGMSYGSGTYWDYATIKYNSAGAQQWVKRYSGPGNGWDEAYAIAIDSSGNVYVTGESYGGSGTYDDYATIKYNSSGVQQWVARYNGPGNSGDEASAIALDSSGNVYVTGNSGGDYATIKYNDAGVQQWVARYNGLGNDTDWAEAIALDSSGNVYVTGESYGSGTDRDYATIKYNSSGVQQWVARYNGPGNYYDVAYVIALDSSGNVYVTGMSYGSGTYWDYATIKYIQGLNANISIKNKIIQKLENLHQVNYFEGLIPLPLINKYNEEQANSLMSLWKSQIPNPQDNVRNLALDRGILSEKGIKYIFNRDENEDLDNPSEIKGALVMAKDTIGPFGECLSLAVPLEKLWRGANQYINSNPLIPDFIKKFIIGTTRKMFEFALDMTTTILDGINAIYPNPVCAVLKTAITMTKDIVLKGLSKQLGMDIIITFIEPIGVYGITEYGYIPKTQPHLNNAINNLSTLNYSGDLISAETKVNQILNVVKDETDIRDNIYQGTKIAAGIANTTLDLISIAGVFSAGTITAVAQALKLISIAAYAGEGISNGAYLLGTIPEYVNNVSIASFHPDQVSLIETFKGMPIKKLSYSLQNNTITVKFLGKLKEITQDYNDLVQQVVTAINNDDLATLETLLPQLLQKDEELNGDFKNAIAPLLGVAANANLSDPNFKTNYENTFDSLVKNDTERFHLYGLIIEYLLSTQGKPERKVEDIKTDIQNQATTTTTAVNTTEQKITDILNQTSGVQSAPVVSFILNNVQESYECNNKYSINATIKNVGAGTAENVTVTLDLNPEEDFYILTDKTVTIGNLLENEEKFVYWDFGIYQTSSKSKLVCFTFSADTTNGIGTQLAKGSVVTNSTTNVKNPYWSLY